MAEAFYPRLSEARDLFPLLRAHLAAAAPHHSLAANLSVALWPIVEDGVFGYEIVPSVESGTYLTIGRDERGATLLRRNLYCAKCPLRLAAVNGCVLTSEWRESRRQVERDDATFADWSAATEAAWAGLGELYPEEPRRAIEIRDDRYRRLDDALATTLSLLVPQDPCIDFCGVPNEAQYGFALTGRGEGCGLLALQPQGCWDLRWESPASALHRQWPASPPSGDAAGAWARAAAAASESALPPAPRGSADTGAFRRQPR
jgi:hypothetical protein